MRILAKNLKYVYSEKSKSLAFTALKNVNISIEEGEFFGIIGKTGSGKSTFIQHLNGLITAQSNGGTLMVGEYDLTNKKCDFNTLRSKIGMVFQYPEHQLFAETVEQDVAYALKNFRNDLSEEEIKRKVKTALELVGLDYESVKDKSPFDLSGGQKRRVAIAGVLVYEPEVLVLDEPVAGLDPKGKKDFISLLKKVHQTFVKTIIIVSHDMDLICENCSSLALFLNGEVLKQGTPKEIFLDEELIKKAELDLPLTAKLTLKLKEKGIEVSSNLKIEDFISAYATIRGIE